MSLENIRRLVLADRTDAVLEDVGHVTLDEILDFLRPTLEAGSLTIEGILATERSEVDTRAVDFQTDSDDGRGMRSRFVIENNVGVACVDMHIRDAVVNIGDPDPAVSSDGTQVRIFQPTGGTSNPFTVFKLGEGGQGLWKFQVRSSGGITQRSPGTYAYFLRPEVIDAPNNQAIFDIVAADGKMEWGAPAGDVVPDTNLYRDAADILKTDDKFVAGAGIGVGNSAAATTPGTVTKKIEVFDADGVSLGFVAVYDAIT